MLQYYQMFILQVKNESEHQEKSSDVPSLQFWLMKNLQNGTADGSSLMS